jgi:hypothetical protein
MNDKPRIGRPKGAGTYKMVGVYGTEHEIAAVLELTPRERLEAMLDKIAKPDNGLPPQCPRCGQRHTWKHLEGKE